MPHKIIVQIGKTENNYAACIEGLDGFVCTAKTLEKLKQEVQEGIVFHLKGLKIDGDSIPEGFEDDYELIYKWDVESILGYYKGVLTLAGLERITGINQTQLGHYAAGRSKPRKPQMKKIEKALQDLGHELSVISF